MPRRTAAVPAEGYTAGVGGGMKLSRNTGVSAVPAVLGDGEGGGGSSAGCNAGCSPNQPN